MTDGSINADIAAAILAFFFIIGPNFSSRGQGGAIAFGFWKEMDRGCTAGRAAENGARASRPHGKPTKRAGRPRSHAVLFHLRIPAYRLLFQVPAGKTFQMRLPCRLGECVFS
jgi:hypothetical protein